METIRGLDVNGPAIIGTGITFTVLASVSVVLRIVSKTLTQAPFGFEDWTSFLALAIYIVAEALVIQSDLVGRQASSPESDDFVTYIYYVYIYSIFYFCVTALCLSSVLFLYKRLFIRPSVQRTAVGLLLLVLGWIIEVLIIEIFADALPVAIPHDPTQHQWHVGYLSFWFVNGIIEQLITLAAILIPLLQVYRLNLSRKKRTMLTVVFAVSALCFITGILRLALLYRPGQSSIDLTLGDILLNVHLGTAIMSANLPVCWPVISHRRQIRSFFSRHGRSTRRLGHKTTETSHGTLKMDAVKMPRRLSSAHLREQHDLSFDPRGATTWSEARRVESGDSEMEALSQAAERNNGAGITVTKTVDVTKSV